MTLRPSGRKPASRASNGRPPPLSPFTVESFRYPDQLGLTGPQLILGIRVKDSEFERPETQRAYRFAPTGRKWHRLALQSGEGSGGRAWRYHASVLTPANEAITEHMRQLCHEFAGIAAAPGGGPYLSTAISYREALLGRLSADCDLTHRDLSAGHFPVDPGYWPRLTSDVLPADLDDLLEFETGYERARGSVGRWSLVIVEGGR